MAIYHGPTSTALSCFSSLGFSMSVTINPTNVLLDLTNGTVHNHITFAVQLLAWILTVGVRGIVGVIGSFLRINILKKNNVEQSSLLKPNIKPGQQGTLLWRFLSHGIRRIIYWTCGFMSIPQPSSLQMLWVEFLC